MINLIRNNSVFIVLTCLFLLVFDYSAKVQKHQEDTINSLVKSSTIAIVQNTNTVHDKAIEENSGVLEINIDKLPTNVIAKDLPKPKVHRIKIWEHKGGKALNLAHLNETVYAVLHKLPNIKANKHAVNMIVETYMVETDLGAAKYEHSAKHWKNYGIGQMREDTAKYLLKTLMTRDTKTYKAVMRYYNRRLSMKDNLLKNIPFSIAMTAQYYTLRGVDISIASTITQRARFWKKEWNTAKGIGTVEKYTAKVISYRSKTDNLI